jgi:hypothetical protein
VWWYRYHSFRSSRAIKQSFVLEDFHERRSVDIRPESVVFGSADRLAQGRAEAVQEGGSEQPLLVNGGQTGQDLPNEVLLHLVGHPLEVAQKGLGIILVEQGQRDEVQADGPPLDDIVQVGERRLAQAQARALRHATVGLRSVELEIPERHLRELASASHRSQGQRRIAPGDQDQVEAPRWMRQQLGEQIVHFPLVDGLVVVQDQDEGGLDRVQLVRKAAREHRGRRQIRGLDQLLRLGTRLREHRTHRGDQVGRERTGVVVAPVEGEPGAGLVP